MSLFNKNYLLKSEKKSLHKKLYFIENEILVIQCSDRMQDFKLIQLLNLRKRQAEIKKRISQIELDLNTLG